MNCLGSCVLKSAQWVGGPNNHSFISTSITGTAPIRTPLLWILSVFFFAGCFNGGDLWLFWWFDKPPTGC